jgi:hypothetical protein
MMWRGEEERRGERRRRDSEATVSGLLKRKTLRAMRDAWYFRWSSDLQGCHDQLIRGGRGGGAWRRLRGASKGGYAHDGGLITGKGTGATRYHKPQG